jgi:hypothetical protein
MILGRTIPHPDRDDDPVEHAITGYPVRRVGLQHPDSVAVPSFVQQRRGPISDVRVDVHADHLAAGTDHLRQQRRVVAP